jgi:hypothetical protein
MITSYLRLIQKDNFATNWKLRGPPAVKSLPAVVSGRPKLDDLRNPGPFAFSLSRTIALANPLLFDQPRMLVTLKRFRRSGRHRPDSGGAYAQVAGNEPFQLQSKLLRHRILQRIVKNVDSRRVRPDRARARKGIERCGRINRKTSHRQEPGGGALSRRWEFYFKDPPEDGLAPSQ